MNKTDYENLALEMATMEVPEWTKAVESHIKDLGMKVALSNMGLVKRGFKSEGEGKFVWDGTVSLAADKLMRSKNYLSKATAEALTDEQIARWTESIVMQDIVIESFVRGKETKFTVTKMPGESYAQVFIGDDSNISIGFLTITTDSRSPWIIPTQDNRPRFFTYTRFGKAMRENEFQNTIVGWTRKPTPKGMTKNWTFQRPDNGEEILVDNGTLSHTLINEVLKEQFGITPVVLTSAAMTMLSVVKVMKDQFGEGEKMMDVDGVTLELVKGANEQTVKLIVDAEEVGNVSFKKGNFSSTYFCECNFKEDVTLPINDKLIVNAVHTLLGCDSGFKRQETNTDMTAEVGTCRPSTPKADTEFKPNKKGKKYGKKHTEENHQQTVGEAVGAALDAVQV